MKWYDITLPMHKNTPTWPGQKSFERKVLKEINEDSHSYVSRISLSTHFATHVDAPFHYIKGGTTITEIDINLLIGPCQVIEIKSDKKFIEIDDLKNDLNQGESRLLVKTKNSNIINDSKFHKNFISFSIEAVTWLVENGIKLLGIDYFSIAPFEDTAPVHKIFLQENNTLALEGIDLSQIKAGKYQLICLPMKIKGAGGAPARVLLGEN